MSHTNAKSGVPKTQRSRAHGMKSQAKAEFGVPISKGSGFMGEGSSRTQMSKG